MGDAFVYSIDFICIAMLGGLTRAIIQSRTARDLTRWDRVKSVLLAPIAGIVYFLMHTEWNAPDHVVTFFFAYSFVDIVDRLARVIIDLGKRGT